MACLASWFPNIPVGLFGIVLAVLGALVSIIEFKGKKRFWWASAFILFGVLETTAIIRADRIHDAEVKAQHDEIEGIKKELSDARLENAANTGWLRAKLEDALQKGPPVDLNKLGQEIAKADADLIAKQSVKLTNKQLAESANVLVAKLLEFDSRYKRQENELLTQQRYPKPEDMANYGQFLAGMQQKRDHLLEQRDLNFKSLLLPQVEYIQESILSRLKAPVTSMNDRGMGDTIRLGWMVGPDAIGDIAGYLQRISKRLEVQ